MPTVRYIGRDPDGQILPTLGELHVPHGGTVEVSDALAAELVAREDGTQWSPVAASKSKPAPAADTDKEPSQ